MPSVVPITSENSRNSDRKRPMTNKRVAAELVRIAKVLSGGQFVNPSVCLDPDRKVNERELTRLLRQGLAAEEEAVHLYEFIADATDNELVRSVVQDIADEERVHVGEFQRLLNELVPDEQEMLDDGAGEVEDKID